MLYLHIGKFMKCQFNMAYDIKFYVDMSILKWSETLMNVFH